MKIKQEDRLIIKKLLYLFKPYIKNIIVIFICMLISAGINILIPLLSKQIVDNGLIGNDFKLLIKLVGISVFLVMTDQGIGLLETRYRVLISSKLPYELSKRGFKKILKLNIRYFNNTNYGEIMNNLNMDIGRISRIADSSLFFIVAQVFKMAGGVVGLFLIDWRLTIIVLVIIPAKYKLVKFFARKRKEVYVEYMEANSAYSSWFGEVISGVKEIRLMGMERQKTGQFVKKQRKLVRINIKLNILDKVNQLSETVLFELIIGLLYIIGAYLILNVNFTVGGLMAFITYSVNVIAPISAVLNIGYIFSDILPSAKRYFEFLDMEQEEVKIKPRKKFEPDKIEGCLKFENVSFRYSEEIEVLKDITFEVHSGEKVAIIGANGCGKTTLINLLLRFLKPQKGRILLDDIDIGTAELGNYRQMISVVSQNIYLFNTTVKENITPCAEKNGIKARKAAKISGINDFINKLPQNYDTIVGSNGANLSGGQRQKVAMARAIARDSKILILDEATSNYDMESEMEIIDLIINRLNNKTVLAVTHKLPVLKAVDRIIFLENGKIADCGKHDELFERNKKYREIINNFNRDTDENLYDCSLSV